MTRKKKLPTITSADEAVEHVEGIVHGFEDDPDPFEINEMNMINLRNLVRKIWEDAYQTGRSDQLSDAAIEAAEAEWFGG